MAAPSCFVTTFRRNLENELPRRHRAVPAARARARPRPRGLPRGAGPEAGHHPGEGEGLLRRPRRRSRYGRLRQLYRLLGAEENVKLFIGPTGTATRRRTARRCTSGSTRHRHFRRQDRAEAGRREGRDAVVHAEGPGGRAAIAADSCSPARSRKRSRQARQPRRHGARPDGRTRRSGFPSATACRSTASSARCRSQVSEAARAAYIVETERGVFALVYRLSEPHLSRPPRETKQAVLYVSHHSADAELRNEPLLRELIKADRKRRSTRATCAASASRPRRPRA